MAHVRTAIDMKLPFQAASPASSCCFLKLGKGCQYSSDIYLTPLQANYFINHFFFFFFLSISFRILFLFLDLLCSSFVFFFWGDHVYDDTATCSQPQHVSCSSSSAPGSDTFLFPFPSHSYYPLSGLALTLALSESCAPLIH